MLHVCCGPCAVMPIVRLLDEGFSVTALFMNPNIQPLTEYQRRRDAALKAAALLHVDIICADETWAATLWLRSVAGRDTKPGRCVFCCESRIAVAFVKAAELDFDCVSTSLLYSRYQPHDCIAAAGRRMDEEHPAGPRFVYRDFRNDWQEGIALSKRLGLYRQAYCGCVYSEAERYDKRLAVLVTR